MDAASRQRSTTTRAPSTPVAIAGTNSPFDDFNAASQAGIYSDHIVFSTSRGAGANFDLYMSTITWMRSDGGQGGYDLHVVGYAGCPRV